MIKVALVDDQTLVRAGIRSLLGLVPDIQVVGEGENGDDAVELAASGGIDVLLLDLRMPPRRHRCAGDACCAWIHSSDTGLDDIR